MDNNNNNQNNQAFIRKNKNILVLVVAVVVVIVLAILVSYSRTSAPAAPAEETTTEETATDETAAAPAPASSDFDAVYKSYEGKRLVISGECEVAPSVLTIAPDTTIMAFNDSAVARTVLIDGASYKIGVKKYRTVKISQPGSLDVGCDGKSSVATIISR